MLILTTCTSARWTRCRWTRAGTSRCARVRDVDPLVRFVFDAITQDRVRGSVEQVRPDHWLYAAGRQASAYRGIAALGGWPQLPPGPTLKPGASDPRVPLLRERLAVTGDLAAVAPPPNAGAPSPASPEVARLAATAAGAADPLLFDVTLEAAVRHFQKAPSPRCRRRSGRRRSAR